MRRHRSDESESKDRWLVPYADFLTLLLALFVVLYAISQGSEGKSRALAASLISAFGARSASPDITEMVSHPEVIERKSVPMSPSAPAAPVPRPGRHSRLSALEELAEVKEARRSAEAQRRREDRMEAIARDLMVAFAPFTSLLENGQIKLIRRTAGLGVEINARVLFAPGQSIVQEGSGRVLEAVADALKNTEHLIQVEGHTDSIPIVTEKFPSNWELAAARASSVVRLLTGYGVESARLTVLGYGENRPVDSNDTEEGRRRNRRVTVLILSDLPGAEFHDFSKALLEASPRDVPHPYPEPGLANSGA